MKRFVVLAAGAAAFALVLSACGGDDPASPGSNDSGAAGSVDSGASGSSSGASTLVVDGEELEVTSGGLCHLEPQEESGGDGQILATAQIRGTNAAGQSVNFDFTRYDADSQFHGDSVHFTVGSGGSDGWLTGHFDEGTVSVSGDTVSADDLAISDSEAGLSSVVSFKIAC